MECLIAGLRDRFGSLDVETSIMSIIELLTYKRKTWESIDDAIARFEATRTRATNNTQQFDMPVAALAWMLLEALSIPRPIWPLIFQASGGQLPTTDEQLRNMMIMVRQQGHFAEHTHAGPRDLYEGMNKGGYRDRHYFSDEGAPPSDEYGSWYQESNGRDAANSSWEELGSYMSTGHGRSSRETNDAYVTEEWVTDSEGWPCCGTCQSYLYDGDDHGSTDTESEPDMSDWTPDEMSQYLGEEVEGDTYENLKQEYLYAKRRFRSFGKKNPRRTRFPRKSWEMPRKGRFGRGKGYHYGKGASVVGPFSLAGGKGKHGKKGGGKGKTSSSYVTQLNPKDANGQVMRCHECDSDQHLVAKCPKRRPGKGKGKAFYVEEDNQGIWSGIASGSDAVQFFTHEQQSGVIIEEIDQEEEASYPTTVHRNQIVEFNIATPPENDTDRTSGTSLRSMQQLVNFPWWKIDATEPTEGDNYLVRTRMKSKPGEALLVDPGSPENLCGDAWSRRMQQAATDAGRPNATYTPLAQKLEVGGVGTGTQTATHAVKVAIGLPGGIEGTFEAPEIPNSTIPALLGQKALMKARVVLDCYNKKMYRVGPGGYKMSLSPGSEVQQLEESHAGHLMLPCTEFSGHKSDPQMSLLARKVESLRQRTSSKDQNKTERAHKDAPPNDL